MTKWGVLGTASLNISTVYVCLACSSSASASQSTQANSNEKQIRHKANGVRFSAEAMMDPGRWTPSLLVRKEDRTPLRRGSYRPSGIHSFKRNGRNFDWTRDCRFLSLCSDMMTVCDKKIKHTKSQAGCMWRIAWLFPSCMFLQSHMSLWILSGTNHVIFIDQVHGLSNFYGIWNALFVHSSCKFWKWSVVKICNSPQMVCKKIRFWTVFLHKDKFKRYLERKQVNF